MDRESQQLLPEAAASSSSQQTHSNRKMSDEGSRGAALAFMFGAVVIGAFVLFNSVQDEPGRYSSTISSLKKKQTTSKPNIVFFLADDLGYNSLDKTITPWMHSMMKDGITLTSYYSMEVCTPSRAALLTGRHPLVMGWQYSQQVSNEDNGVSLSETFLPEVLKDNGYTNYIFGKWNLGNQSPRYLPTARGFDYFVGYLNGYNNYWSKTDPSNSKYVDFMVSNTKCYYNYDADDLDTYSTMLYRDKAIEVIESHDYTAGPMFLYLAFQAVHSPFSDTNSAYPKAIPEEYLDADTYSYITDTYSGSSQQEYFKSLAVMDDSIKSVYKAMKSAGALDNSYIIFASDNGGCPTAGGRNYPLRGTKGSLFEGGTKVDAFVYSPLLNDEMQGVEYDGLFHVTDWFPTILGLAEITYKPEDGYELSGFDQTDSMFSLKDNDSPRTGMLYNYYYNPADPSASTKTFWTSVPCAVRNSQYKLMHTYEASDFSGLWYEASAKMEDDDKYVELYQGCTQEVSQSGTFTYYLFDLKNDPYETTNLYSSDDKDITSVKNKLYALMEEYQDQAAAIKRIQSSDPAAQTTWSSNDNYVIPWQVAEDVSTLPDFKSGLSYPQSCGSYEASGRRIR